MQLASDDAPRQLLADSFSPDGLVLTFFSLSAGTGFDLGFLRLNDIDPYAGKRPESEFLLETRFNAGWARFSPDGRLIAYFSDESVQYDLYVRRFPDGPRRQISSNAGLA